MRARGTRRRWSARELAELRRRYPVTPTSALQMRGRTAKQIRSQARNLGLKKCVAAGGRFAWTPKALALLRRLYPHTRSPVIAARLGTNVSRVYSMAYALGLKKSQTYLAGKDSSRLRTGEAGRNTRFVPGHAPHNKGVKGWMAGGRSAETRFKPGQVTKRWDPEQYAVGALRMNAAGYVDMKMHDGYRPWKQFHRVLWEDANGPIPRGLRLVFKDRDPLNLCLENLELLSAAEMMRRNTIHNLPAPLKTAIQLLGQLKRRIREQNGRGSAGAPVRRAGRAARPEEPDGDRARAGDR